MKPTLTIAIPTWHNAEQLSNCLSTLVNYTKFPFKVIVIDNGCDAVMEQSSESWPDNVEYVNPGENKGWMGGINHALEMCDTSLFCMMNDDVAFLPSNTGFWQELTSHFLDDTVGIVGPASDFIAGTQAISCVTPLCFNASVIMGVCIVTKTAFLRDLGGLDETLPGGDDLDLCVRVRQAGKHVRVDKRAYLHHLGQQSGRRAQGEYYDGVEHQEMVKNAIAAKHGMKAWGEVYAFSIQEDLRDPYAGEGDHEWIEALKTEGMVLNFGCGAHRIEGAINIDINDAEAHGEGGMFGVSTEADQVFDVTDLPYDEDFADVIISSHLLEHLIDPIKALKEWHRVLKPGGDLVLITPDQDRVPSQVMDPTHVHCYNIDSLKSLLAACGFEVYTSEGGFFNSIRVVATVQEEVIA